MQPQDILSVDNLSLSFPSYDGHVPVLHGVSFSVKKGETLAIVGESGSGKTVTMRRVMHLLAGVRTDSGTILLRRKDGSIIEGGEHGHLPIDLVQWHPELIVEESSGTMLPLFSHLVDNCS